MQQTVTPTGWEWAALIPMMVLMMAFMIVMKLITEVTKPEVLEAARPIAEAALWKGLK